MVIMNSLDNTNYDIDDIQYLLHLESVKQYTDEMDNMQRYVEEQGSNFLEAKREYQREFAHLVNLCKNVKLCEVLNHKNAHIIDAHVPTITSHLAEMNAPLTNDKRPTEIDREVLEKCKQQLRSNHAARDGLSRNQQSLANNREVLGALHTMLDSVETNIELSTLAAMDQMIIDLQPPK